MSTPIPGPIDARWPGECFGCSPGHAHGLRLTFERTADGCVTRPTLAGDLCGIRGYAHGGIVATLLDEVCGWALIGHYGRFGLTRTLSIEYLRPVPTGEPIVARARILAREGRDARVEGQVEDAAGTVLARAHSEWVLVDAANVAKRTGMDAAPLLRFLRDAAPHAVTDPSG